MAQEADGDEGDGGRGGEVVEKAEEVGGGMPGVGGKMQV